MPIRPLSPFTAFVLCALSLVSLLTGCADAGTRRAALLRSGLATECAPGETAVDRGTCPPRNSVCYLRADGRACTAGPIRTTCRDGETRVATEGECLVDDAVCYPLPDMGFCTGPAVPECPEGLAAVRSPSECIADDAVCFRYSEGVWCTGPASLVLPSPGCQSGETEVAGPDACLADDAVCYDLADGRWCTGPSTTVVHDVCISCLAGGGSWQPEAAECTRDCAIQDISCFTPDVGCPGACAADSCGNCFDSAGCLAAGCAWNAEGEAMWCTSAPSMP